MKKFKKIISTTLMASLFLSGVGIMTGCQNESQEKISIADVEMNESGELIINYTDGSIKNVGKVKGNDGQDGLNGQNGQDGQDGKNVEIESAYVDENGELIIVLVGGQKINAGKVSEPKTLNLNKAGSFDVGVTSEDGGIAEIVKYNKDNSKFYLVNGKTKTLDIVTLGLYKTRNIETTFNEATDRIDFNSIVENNKLDFADGFVVGDITSVSINTELDVIAVALQHQDFTKAGAVVLLDYDGNYVMAYSCGVQPDMVLFSGDLVLTADEGEPRDGYIAGTVDPKGSVSIIDLSNGVKNGVTKVVTFDSFDDKRDSLVNAGVLLKKNTAPSVDFEPEYITVTDGYAYVALQEANAIAKLNLETKEFEAVLPLGFKDHSVEGNGLDLLEDGKISIETQNVYGVYMPDGIDSFTYNNETYIVTANEGDAREWGDYSGVTKTKIQNTKVETLNNSEWDGLDDEKVYILGGRSFSIFKASDMSLVYDSGDLIEKTIAESDYSDYFNASNNNVTLDSRSKKKGPEPESVLIRELDGKLYAFVGLERISGVMTFDVTNFITGDVTVDNFTTTRDYSDNILGDVGPEGMDFVYDDSNPFGKNLLFVANENSGTVSIYTVEDKKKDYEIHQTYIPLSHEESDSLVIYSVAGSGGNVDGAISHDYIAIKNISTEEINLDGYKIEYAENGATADTWNELALTGSMEAGDVLIIRCKEANPSATFNISSYDYEWSDVTISNKAFSIRLTLNDDVVDLLGVDADGLNTESFEGNAVADMSKQKIIIRLNDIDTNNNSLDFEVVSFKGLTSDSEEVKTYLTKMGLN